MTQLPLMNRELGEVLAWHQNEHVTAGRFVHQAHCLARRLPAGGHTINLCHDRYIFSLAFAAAIIARSTTLLPANRLPATVDELLERFPDSVVIRDRPIEGMDHPCLDPTALRYSDGQADVVPLIDADLLAAIVFTSGTSGPGSSILKPWYTLYFSSLINAVEYGPTETLTHAVATVPPQHMWGLETSVLLPWFSPLCMASGQPFFAVDIIDQLRALPEPRALFSAPVHLRTLAECGQPLESVARIYSATAPLSVALARELESRTGARVTEVYGCSEAGCLAWREPAHGERWQPFQAFSFERVNGTYQVDAGHLTGPVPLLDHLQVDQDGLFRLAGRHGDLVNIAGKRASLCELTERLLAIDGVVDGVIFQPPERADGPVGRLAALVVAPNLSMSELRRELARHLDPAFMPRPLRLVEYLPRAENGKLPRQTLDRFFQQVCEQTA
ncbi:MAG: AMP-binding protein [Wenzhouxiangella sp.]